MTQILSGVEQTRYRAVRERSTKRNAEPTKASRPFDADRDGFVIGEGAGVLVLEEYEHAKKRGARIYCEVAGYGRTDDAFHITAPDTNARGATRSMVLAMQYAGVNGADVDYINAHGTSTELNDKGETLAIKQSLGALCAEHDGVRSADAGGSAGDS